MHAGRQSLIREFRDGYNYKYLLCTPLTNIALPPIIHRISFTIKPEAEEDIRTMNECASAL